MKRKGSRSGESNPRRPPTSLTARPNRLTNAKGYGYVSPHPFLLLLHFLLLPEMLVCAFWGGGGSRGIRTLGQNTPLYPTGLSLSVCLSLSLLSLAVSLCLSLFLSLSLSVSVSLSLPFPVNCFALIRSSLLPGFLSIRCLSVFAPPRRGSCRKC